MTTTTSYLIYQAERIPSHAEQVGIDSGRGELARGLSSLLHRRHARPAASVRVPDYVPAEWVASAPVTCSSVNCPKSA